MAITVTNHTTEAYGWQQWHISRPERMNALGTTIANELCDTLDFFRKTPPPGVRAIVITAETVIRGDRCFWIAGGDLKELSQLREKADGRRYAATMRSFCEGLEYLPLPVITVLDGAAIGGGAELALCGDIRLATVRSSLEFKQLKLGLATGYGAASKLVSLVGKSKAQSLLYFCESITAEDAIGHGLVHRLISSSDHSGIGTAILPILQLEPLAVAAQKKMLRHASELISADHSWADEIFESIWMNDTHAKNLSEFSNR